MWDNREWKNWRLVVKCDPDKDLPGEALKTINYHTVDAVLVGGTQGITQENTAGLIRLIRESGYNGLLVQEISSEDVVVPGADAYLIPAVLNAGDRRWLVGEHLNAVKRYAGLIPWDRVLTEGYLVCNRDSAVGRLTCAEQLTAEDAAAYTVLAEEIFCIPLLYIEYSGIFGDMELVRAVSRAKKNIHLFYGGGIKTPEHLKVVAPLVDTVVIGNIIYENPIQALELVKSIYFMPEDKS